MIVAKWWGTGNENVFVSWRLKYILMKWPCRLNLTWNSVLESGSALFAAALLPSSGEHVLLRPSTLFGLIVLNKLPLEKANQDNRYDQQQ